MDQKQGQHEGTDYVCDNCGCEIMVKHTGDPWGHGEGRHEPTIPDMDR